MLIPETIFPNICTNKTAAEILSDEFLNLQDCDGNGLIYGYDFFIKGYSKPAPLLDIESNIYWKFPSKCVTDWKTYLEKGTDELKDYKPYHGDIEAFKVKQNFESVRWLDANISSYKKNGNLAMTVLKTYLVFEYNKTDSWNKAVVYMLVRKDGKWYCKNIKELKQYEIEMNIEGVKIDKDPITNFEPGRGYRYGFVLANHDLKERTNLVTITWP